VFGLEAQGNWADFKGSNTSLFAPAFRNESKVNAFGLFTGQVGYAANNALFYLKGGAAVTSNSYRSYTIATNALAGSTSDDTRWGGVIGVGAEYAFAPNWSLGLEYDHLFMQDKTYTFTTPAGAFFANDRIRQDVDLVTARLNYKFGGPVVAKY
jgi:outer membrane immunogenic protein